MISIHFIPSAFHFQTNSVARPTNRGTWDAERNAKINMLYGNSLYSKESFICAGIMIIIRLVTRSHGMCT